MPRGHGPNRGVSEKPKNLKSAIKKLFVYLKNFRLLILFSIILATLGAILSIIGPNKLSDLTDEISSGLIINQDNMKEISIKITSNFAEDKMPIIISSIMMDESIDSNDKMILSSFDFKNDDISNLPISIQNKLFSEFKYNDSVITVSDQIEFVKTMSSIKTSKDSNLIYSKLDKLPDSIKKQIKPKMNVKNIKKIGIFLIILYLF